MKGFHQHEIDLRNSLEGSCHYILNVATAESNRQLSILKDKHSEKLAYPGIFLGQKRPENEHGMVKVHGGVRKLHMIQVHHSDISKPELLMNHSTAFLVEVGVQVNCT